MMVALARPGDIDDSVTVRFDKEAEGIGVRLPGALAGIPSVTGVAALAQYVHRYQRTGFSRAFAAVEIGEARKR